MFSGFFSLHDDIDRSRFRIPNGSFTIPMPHSAHGAQIAFHAVEQDRLLTEVCCVWSPVAWNPAMCFSSLDQTAWLSMSFV